MIAINRKFIQATAIGIPNRKVPYNLLEKGCLNIELHGCPVAAVKRVEYDQRKELEAVLTCKDSLYMKGKAIKFIHVSGITRDNIKL